MATVYEIERDLALARSWKTFYGAHSDERVSNADQMATNDADLERLSSELAAARDAARQEEIAATIELDDMLRGANVVKGDRHQWPWEIVTADGQMMGLPHSTRKEALAVLADTRQRAAADVAADNWRALLAAEAADDAQRDRIREALADQHALFAREKGGAA